MHVSQRGGDSILGLDIISSIPPLTRYRKNPRTRLFIRIAVQPQALGEIGRVR